MNSLYQRVQKITSAFLSATLISVSSILPLAQALADDRPPVIRYDDSIDKEITEGQPFTLSADVTDPDGIARVSLYLRSLGSKFDQRSMQFDPSTDATYFYEFNAEELKPPFVEFYIEAQDFDNNLQSIGFYFDPLRINVQAVATQPVVTVAEPTQGNNTMWYVIGGLLIVGLAAAASGGDDDVTVSSPFVIR